MLHRVSVPMPLKDETVSPGSAADPVTQTVLQAQSPRPGTTLQITAMSTDPNMVLSRTSTAIDSHTDLTQILFTYKVTGAVNGSVVFSASPAMTFLPSNQIPVHSAGPNAANLTVSVPLLAKDFAGQVQIYGFPNQLSTTHITVTSSDPSKVLLYLAPGPAQASVTYTNSNQTV